MPAHSGVEEKLIPRSGSQIPCSQMISMNISPPRDRAESREARLPAAKARILNSGRRNIGAATRRSTATNSASTHRPPIIAPSTQGLVQPMLW